MKIFNLKNAAIVSAFSLVSVLGMSGVANAQGNRDKGNDHGKQGTEVSKQQIRTEPTRTKVEQTHTNVMNNTRVDVNQNRTNSNQDRGRTEQARVNVNQTQVNVNVNQDRSRDDQKRRDDNNRNNFNRNNDRSHTNVFIGGNAYVGSRFRVIRNGNYYNTDQRGVDLLRQAINAGYEQGYSAGVNDRNGRRGLDWGHWDTYRNGIYGYDSYVDRGQYQYYFQQGFQRGYEDGYNRRFDYGYNNGGRYEILGGIIGSILDIATY